MAVRERTVQLNSFRKARKLWREGFGGVVDGEGWLETKKPFSLTEWKRAILYWDQVERLCGREPFSGYSANSGYSLNSLTEWKNAHSVLLIKLKG